MSYCRWSCLGGQCDLYIYADVNGGVTIHVAEVRRDLSQADVPEDPTPAMVAGHMDPEEWRERYKARNEALETCALLPIGLSRDGQSFNLDFPEAADLVADLRAEGYQIPEGIEGDIRADVRILDETLEPFGCRSCGEVAAVERYFTDVEHVHSVLMCSSCGAEADETGIPLLDDRAKSDKDAI